MRNTAKLWALAAALLLAIGVTSSWADPSGSDTPLGMWTTENGKGVVAISPCGGELCGRIVGLDRSPDEPMPTDVNGRPECGLTIITNQREERPGTWFGHITDPRNGSVYQAEIWVDQGALHLRGYLGIPLLGQTQVWHPFNGSVTRDCAVEATRSGGWTGAPS